MPSPIGHTLAGLAVLAARDAPEHASRARAAVVVGAAVAADLDLLLRFVDGRNHHQAESHSVGAALLAALLVWAGARLAGAARPARLAMTASLAWLSHLALDYLNRDTHPPIGIMAFWPWSYEYFKFPWPLFLDIGRTLEWATVYNNALAAAWEVAVLLPLLLLVRRLRARRRG
ncbi:MAG: metal-dependent hydrolase [Acidobacteria bacterium]|nr:metal-dependent hydrolase [Acidobacteriota bacterium]